jgi:hypothetical protein
VGRLEAGRPEPEMSISARQSVMKMSWAISKVKGKRYGRWLSMSIAAADLWHTLCSEAAVLRAQPHGGGCWIADSSR